jgi:hypothetical protein
MNNSMIYTPNPNFNFQSGWQKDIDAQWWGRSWRDADYSPSPQYKLLLTLFPNLMVDGVEPYSVFKDFTSDYYGGQKDCYGFLREDGFEFGFCSYYLGDDLLTELSIVPNANLKLSQGIMGDYLLDESEILPFIDWAMELVKESKPLLDFQQMSDLCHSKGYMFKKINYL